MKEPKFGWAGVLCNFQTTKVTIIHVIAEYLFENKLSENRI